jgi:uncharacterized membrane protein YdbT with pleckstrin-like domain
MEHNFTKYHFDGQNPDENILLVLHRHWFSILSQFFVIFVMLLLFFGSYGLTAFFYANGGDPSLSPLFAFLRNLFFIFIWITFFVIWIDYYFDVWIVTDKRIVNIEQKGLFARETSELQLEKIQDVATDVKGVIPTFLNYGTIEVQTAGEQEKFIFKDIPDPYAVKDLIMQLQKKFEQQENVEFSRMLSEKIHHDNDTL